MVPVFQVGSNLSTFTREISFEDMVEFEQVVWARDANAHNDAEVAKRDGLVKPLASGQTQMALLHELLEKSFGDGWVYGGKISVRYIRPVYAGDRLTPHGVVSAINAENGAPQFVLDVWCENQDGQKTAAGTAHVGQPTQKMSWIEGAQA